MIKKVQKVSKGGLRKIKKEKIDSLNKIRITFIMPKTNLRNIGRIYSVSVFHDY